LYDIAGEANLYAHDTRTGKTYKVGQLNNTKINTLQVGRQKLLRAVDDIFTQGATFRGASPVSLDSNGRLVVNSLTDAITDLDTVINTKLVNGVDINDIKNYLEAIGQSPTTLASTIRDKIELAW
jgi:hypothetical protein